MVEPLLREHLELTVLSITLNFYHLVIINNLLQEEQFFFISGVSCYKVAIKISQIYPTMVHIVSKERARKETRK